MDEYEQRFYDLCLKHNWACNKIPEGDHKTVDFYVQSEGLKFLVEVTHIEKDTLVAGGRTVGNKLRNKINEKTEQTSEHVERECLPLVFLIYDESQTVYSEYTDVVVAMFGELTISIDKKTGEGSRIFHGKKSEIRANKNTSISALGIKNIFSNKIIIYKNPYAKHPLQIDFKKYDSFEEYNFSIQDS